MAELRTSVVIPAFNAERFLGDAIESALLQTPAPFEVLVVDDGSSDATVEIAERFAPRVRCLRQAHAGQGAARNTGNAAALGELIAPLDADDLWPAGSLGLRLEALLAAPEVDVVTGQVAQFRVCERGVPVTLGLPQVAPISSALLLRRGVVARFGPQPVGDPHAELSWWLSATRAGMVVKEIAELVAFRRIHGDNLSLRDKPARERALVHLLKAHLDLRRENR